MEEGGLRVYPLILVFIDHARLYIETFSMITNLTNYMEYVVIYIHTALGFTCATTCSVIDMDAIDCCLLCHPPT